MCKTFPTLLGQVLALYPLFKISHLEQILDLASLHLPRGLESVGGIRVIWYKMPQCSVYSCQS